MNRASFAGVMPPPADRDPAFAECGESVFYERDVTKRSHVSTTDLVTLQWYSGMKEYNFKEGMPKVQYNNEDGDWLAVPGECKLTVGPGRCD
jgi:hypothetical protein